MPRVRRVLHHNHALVLLQKKAAPWEGPEAGQEGWEWNRHEEGGHSTKSATMDSEQG